MPTIPLPPIWKRRRSSPVDTATKLKLVIDALIAARDSVAGRGLRLVRTEENKLAQLYRHEVVSALERIAKTNEKLFIIPSENYPKHIRVFDGGVSGDSIYKTREVKEKAPIVLNILDNFQNWCEAQLHKQAVTWRELSDQNCQKVFSTVAAIYQKFELSSNPQVRIGWIPASTIENAESRRLSLEFLRNQDVIKSYAFKYYSEFGEIKVDVNTRPFLDLKRDLSEHISRMEHSAEETATNPTNALPANAFQSIQGLKWRDIHIRFIDGLTVKITANGISETVDYKEMGLEDLRSRNRNTQWALLGLLSEHEGKIGWEDAAAKDNVKKQKQLLSEKLKAYFGIDEDPFESYRDNKGYRIKLALSRA